MNSEKIKKYKDKLIKELKKLANYEDLKKVDKKILIPFGIVLITLVVLYYVWLFTKYPVIKQFKNNSNNNLPKTEASDSISYDSPMKPSNVIKDNTNSSEVTEKVPKDYMNIENIPTDQKELYIEVFNVLYDYINHINNKKYENAIKFLDQNFIRENNITVEHLKNLYDANYYNQVSFYIQNILPDENYYKVNVIIFDAYTEVGGFEDGFIFIKDKDIGLRIMHNLLSNH